MNSPSVSLLVVARNYARFLTECFGSCIKQTVRPAEFIYVDDASEDESLEVAALFPEFRVVSLKERKGANGARNVAAQEAKGECLLFVDGDNILTPDFLEKSLAALTPDAPFTYPSIERFGEGSPDPGLVAPEWGSQDLRAGNFCDTSSLLWAPALKSVGGWDESLQFWQDWHLSMRLSRLGSPRRSEAVLRHRFHPDSITNSARDGVDLAAYQKQITDAAFACRIDWEPWERHLAERGISEPTWHRTIIEQTFNADWMSILPLERVGSGGKPVFADHRIEWLISRLGGVAGKSILELGSMEGGHSYMLSKAGANVVGVEGNQESYIRTLIAKEAIGFQAAFVPTDFREYLRWCAKSGRRFDIVLAAGVFYHVTDPAELAKLIASVTDCAFFWSHYYDDAKIAASEVGARYFSGATEPVECNGFQCIGYRRDYDVFPTRRGGLEQHSLWLRKCDCIGVWNAAGFNQFELCFENDSNIYGPAFGCLSRKS